jgi:hypothetical protein
VVNVFLRFLVGNLAFQTGMGRETSMQIFKTISLVLAVALTSMSGHGSLAQDFDKGWSTMVVRLCCLSATLLSLEL